MPDRLYDLPEDTVGDPGDFFYKVDSTGLVDRRIKMQAVALLMRRTSVQVIGGATGAINLDVSLYQRFVVTMVGNCTFTFINVPASGDIEWRVVTIQDATGSRTVSFASTKWPNGSAPVASTGANKRDKFVFETSDGGTVIEGNLAGLNYS